MEKTSPLLVIGIGGHAVSLDRETGAEVWRTKLKGSDLVTVQVSGPASWPGPAASCSAWTRPTDASSGGTG